MQYDEHNISFQWFVFFFIFVGPFPVKLEINPSVEMLGFENMASIL